MGSSRSSSMTGTAARPEALGVQAGGTAACAIGITKTYGGGAAAVTALDQVSVALRHGHFTAVLGPSGSGKSTLLHCLAGLDTVDSGTVRIGGTDLTTLDERGLTRLRREHVGFVFQAFNLLPTLTAEENILLPLAIAGHKPDGAWIGRVVDAVGLRGRLRHRPSELSGGEQQRVAAARALAGRPTIVFADEPTGNLDSHASAELLGFLRRSVDELEQTIVMVTHDPIAAGHADEALFLADGRIVDAISRPTAARVLDHLKALGGGRAPGSAAAVAPGSPSLAEDG
jgi:putative ABC transport system ATP-binding protein